MFKFTKTPLAVLLILAAAFAAAPVSAKTTGGDGEYYKGISSSHQK